MRAADVVAAVRAADPDHIEASPEWAHAWEQICYGPTAWLFNLLDPPLMVLGREIHYSGDRPPSTALAWGQSGVTELPS